MAIDFALQKFSFEGDYCHCISFPEENPKEMEYKTSCEICRGNHPKAQTLKALKTVNSNILCNS